MENFEKAELMDVSFLFICNLSVPLLRNEIILMSNSYTQEV